MIWEDKQGMIWEYKQDVEREIVNFYQTLYSTDGWFHPKLEGISFPSLSVRKAEFLEKTFYLNESSVLWTV